MTRRALLLALLALVAAPLAAAAPRGGELGAQLYAEGCATCHGPAGEGVSTLGPARGTIPGSGGRIQAGGPPLRGVGARAADFYLRTGSMPLRGVHRQPRRRTPAYSDAQIDALVAYVAGLGRGPAVPTPHPQRGSLAEGLHLFTEHCSGCHQVLGKGGVVTGAAVPSLDRATPREIAEAVRIGPWVMPRFSGRAIDDRQLDSLVRYVVWARHPDDPGGWAIGHLGPVPEGIVTWLVAAVALVLVAMLIGARLRA